MGNWDEMALAFSDNLGSSEVLLLHANCMLGSGWEGGHMTNYQKW